MAETHRMKYVGGSMGCPSISGGHQVRGSPNSSFWGLQEASLHGYD